MRKTATPVWLFDLDNTLHNASHAIFPAINRNMNAYIARILGDGNTPADEATVNAVRQEYYLRYGVTMIGMVRHHGVKAEEFLQQAHAFDDLPAMIRAERGLSHILRRLPGKKILLTNAPRHYSHRVLRYLNLHRHFDDHIPVEEMRVHGRLQPKPSRLFLRKWLSQHHVAASRCILVEDSLDNLRAARHEGLRTVWVRGYLPLSQRGRGTASVDVRVRSVSALVRRYRSLA
ncbi:pyrimidine 5'-nucleotidase [Undibacterium oligocarboniphilum]|uniref:Pyrimidine 5'-nucleotidase n=1 Tax=Undibacterium oligocarboniphilum TaxID=666702 RepID=A0A850QJU1_9BURK|nr:pyrimidine 5'-nucleotidase [Undibacterium oligocarboniphilum]MBC3870931.1 pyrimidine 5'-nucleotidase [Undibacterium oligocarboniphilum]NVO76446.1 pyrimidine 5'-nucleotidase [Undibacterium oligocarboniphilum]